MIIDNAVASRTQFRIPRQMLKPIPGLSGTWLEPVCTHYCFGILPGRRCCATIAEAKQQAGSSMRKLGQLCVCSVSTVAANKWRSVSQAVTKVSIGLLANGFLRAAFERTLATPAERLRLRQAIQAHHDLLAAGAIDGGGVCDPNAFRVLRRRRILSVHDWLVHPESHLTLISSLVGSVAIDKNFATHFECEAFAKTRGGRSGTGGPFGRSAAGTWPRRFIAVALEPDGHFAQGPPDALRAA